jgi:hypothetical protein
VDLFHAIDHNMTPFAATPFTLTVHDLIPLVMRGPYLGPTAWLWMQAHRLAARRARGGGGGGGLTPPGGGGGCGVFRPRGF